MGSERPTIAPKRSARAWALAAFKADDLGDIRAAVLAEVDAAIVFAENSPMPDPAELLTNVYTDRVDTEAAR